MTVAEAAEYFSITRQSVRDRIKRGTLKATKNGNAWSIDLPSNPLVEIIPSPPFEQITIHQQQEIENLRQQLATKDQQIASLLRQNERALQLLGKKQKVSNGKKRKKKKR